MYFATVIHSYYDRSKIIHIFKETVTTTVTPPRNLVELGVVGVFAYKYDLEIVKVG